MYVATILDEDTGRTYCFVRPTKRMLARDVDAFGEAKFANWSAAFYDNTGQYDSRGEVRAPHLQGAASADITSVSFWPLFTE